MEDRKYIKSSKETELRIKKLSLEEGMSCPICLELYQNPIIVECCGNTFCEKCIVQVKNKCPFCYKYSKYTQNLTLQRIIQDLPVDCECGVAYKRCEEEMHLKVCKAIVRNCKYCSFTGNAVERLDHGFQMHQQILMELYLETMDL